MRETSQARSPSSRALVLRGRFGARFCVASLWRRRNRARPLALRRVSTALFDWRPRSVASLDRLPLAQPLFVAHSLSIIEHISDRHARR